MENTHLIFMLDRLLPGSMGGFDYQVITQYEADGVTLETEAQIHSWNLSGVTQPTQSTLLSSWASTYDAQYTTATAAQATAEAERIQSIIDNSLL